MILSHSNPFFFFFLKQGPYENRDYLQISELVLKGERPIIPRDCPKLFANLITDCWSHNPSHRPSFQAVVEDLKRQAESYHVYL